MSKALVVGCGDLGGAVAARLASLSIETIGVKRSLGTLDGVHMLVADVTQPQSLEALKSIQPDILIYCVAADGPTEQQYQAQYVDGLRHVLATQQDNPQLKHVFFVSSTRVYGQTTDDFLDENTIAIPVDFGGKCLLEAESLLNNLRCQSTALRLSGIYGPGRLRMIKLATSPESWPAQNGWTNRIHRDDAAAFMVHLIQQVLAGVALKPCYIVTDSKPASQYEVLSWIASQLQVKTTNPLPPIAGGKRLRNDAMLGTGFQMQYPDFKIGYQALLDSALMK